MHALRLTNWLEHEPGSRSLALTLARAKQRGWCPRDDGPPAFLCFERHTISDSDQGFYLRRSWNSSMASDARLPNLLRMCPARDVVHHEPIKLRAFVDDVLADFEASDQARHIMLDALVFSEEHRADPSLLHRLRASLVAGAIRRAPAGTNVSLVVSPRARYVEFRVADEGAGIAVATRDHGAKSVSGAVLAAETMGGRVSVAETGR